MSSRSPELVCGRYRVTGKHGASAGFEVLNAIDPGRPGVRVRVVVVPSAGETQASLIVQQTRRYAIAPGVVTATIGELGASPGGQALAFELGTGKLLDELIAGALETRAALALIEGAARALATLHDQGVAHGLVDKALVGVEAGGRVVLGGYGVVQLTRGPGSTLGDDRIALSALAREMLNASQVPLEPELARLLEGANDSKDLIEWAKALGAAFREQLPPVEVVPEAPVEVSQTPPAVVMPNPPASPLAAAPRQPSGWPIAAAVAVSFVLLFGVVVGLFAHRLLTSKAASAPSASTGPTAAAPVTAAPSGDVAPVPAPDPAPPDPSAAPRRQPPLPPARKPRDRTSSANSAAAALPIAPTTPTTDASEALVSAVVFGDLECPHTRRLYRSLTELTRLYAGDLRLAWRHRPLREHGHARQAALFAAAVHEQDGAVAFWRLVADLSRSEDAADPLWLGNWATRQERAFPEFRAPRDSSGAVAQVDDDVALANRFGVRETPTLFVNGLRVRGDRPFDELRATVETELRVSRALLAAGISPNELYATRVSKNLIGIGPDVVDRACPPLARSPRRGAPEPLVTLVVFANFQCPFCRRVQPTLKQLEARYANQLSIVWKHLPLSQHPNAGSAARLALVARERAGDPGFWRVHDLLFAVDPPLDAAGLAGVAERAGLDARALNAVRRGDHQAEIEADIALAKRLGVSGTPTFFVNGRRLGGAQPLSSFDTLIREELEAARRMIGRGVAPEALYAALCGDP